MVIGKLITRYIKFGLCELASANKVNMCCLKVFKESNNKGCWFYFQGYPALQGYMAPGYYQQYAAAYSNPQAAAAGMLIYVH